MTSPAAGYTLSEELAHALKARDLLARLEDFSCRSVGTNEAPVSQRPLPSPEEFIKWYTIGQGRPPFKLIPDDA